MYKDSRNDLVDLDGIGGPSSPDAVVNAPRHEVNFNDLTEIHIVGI